jgi:hypothetical protein
VEAAASFVDLYLYDTEQSSAIPFGVSQPGLTLASQGQIPATCSASSPMSNESTVRKGIIDLLQLFASEEQQLAYERDVPHVDITAELVGMWFDDQYHPNQRHFESCFSPAELAALEEFDKFYGMRVDRLPESKRTVRTWLNSPVWREVMEQVRWTLERVSA